MRRGAFLGASIAFIAAPSVALAGNDEDALFMRIANAAAARFADLPPSISYKVSGVVRAFHGESAFERYLTYSANDERPAFLAPPTFDALSHWTFDMNFNESGSQDGPQRTVDARFSNVAPLRYRTDLGVRADAIVNAVKGYRLQRLAADHIGLTRIDRKRHDASLRDVYFDPQTLLPTRVIYDGRDDFVLDVGYRSVEGHMLVSNLRFGYTAYVLGHLVHSSFACEAQYSDFFLVSS